MKSQILMFFATASVLHMTGGAAWAEPVDAGDALEEVVVTAQKQSQNIQSVPISIIAISGATLAKSGVVDIDDLQRYAPGLTISNVGSGRSTNPSKD